MDSPVIFEIADIIDETPNIKTFVLDGGIDCEVGQYFMVWIPGVDEIPISPSKITPTGLTVQKVGPATEEMFDLSVGDQVGLRGPYGNTFTIRGGEVLIVSGGCGGAPLLPLAKKIKEGGSELTIAVGGRNKEELLFEDQFNRLGEVFVATEDGSKGYEGYITTPVLDVLGDFDTVYSCGPEPMLKKIVENTPDGTYIEVSLQRYVKCGVGVCGSCCMDPDGTRLCVEGPVFNKEELDGTEFGEYRRNASGQKIRF
ncbi:dihydroorotate dehydrogenase electron transfer subunit [Methanonatronarchaeum sp. AMET-Sl]|uniref:dihydroorotate dehydrogenase electron transfer subunit n=1 Tax=Methanonatronarchaeum sp. AMET-Sl TaxID=3037654 RepID=UPI00244D9D4B|nr:dihydroorotate dehydrogenase electron transfer subunit [Methanonatronarchaeum sp. AMET-Sl]WGI17090.1 dihydroorotate dehydrogenase electron transfer subunit [Methanonatronarchaeum sp. AMET-Sl]